MAITVVVADDHPVVRAGVGAMFKGTDIRIIAEATNVEEAVTVALSRKPDVLLIDIRMGKEDGFEAIEQLRKKVPEVAVVIFSHYDSPTFISRAVNLGVRDYLLKSCSRSELVEAIKNACSDDGDPSEILQRFGESHHNGRTPREHIGITDREKQVVRHLILGLSNREIGKALGISVETVKEHVQNILRKIDGHSRTHIAVWAVRNDVR